MPSTGLKIVGTGHVYPGVASPLLLKTAWRRLCIEVLSFWSCWNLVPFLPDIGLKLLKSLWSSLTYFLFNALQMFSIGEISELQAVQFSTRTLLLQSHAVVIAAVCGFAFSCWNTQGLPWNRHCLEGSICCSKTFIYLSAFIVPSKTYKLPIPYAPMHPHTIRDAGFWTERWRHTGRSPYSLARRTRLQFLWIFWWCYVL